MGAAIRPEQSLPRFLSDRQGEAGSTDRCRRSERPEPPVRWRGGSSAMKTASAAKIAAQFDDYLEATREQPVLVTKNGKPVAVLLAVQDKAEAEHLARGRSRTLRSILEEAHEQLQKGG